MADDRLRESRRAIDLHIADHLGRIDEKLKNVSFDVNDLKHEVFGGDGRVGLGEQVRGIVKTWGTIIAIGTTVVSWFPWIWDHFISKTANMPVFGEEVREKWIKQSTKRVRIYNKEKGEWEYFYAIEETHSPKKDEGD